MQSSDVFTCIPVAPALLLITAPMLFLLVRVLGTDARKERLILLAGDTTRVCLCERRRRGLARIC